MAMPRFRDYARDHGNRATENHPHSRPMPGHDVPGFRRANDDFHSRLRDLIERRDQMARDHQNDYRRSVGDYNNALTNANRLHEDAVRRTAEAARMASNPPQGGHVSQPGPNYASSSTYHDPNGNTNTSVQINRSGGYEYTNNSGGNGNVSGGGGGGDRERTKHGGKDGQPGNASGVSRKDRLAGGGDDAGTSLSAESASKTLSTGNTKTPGSKKNGIGNLGNTAVGNNAIDRYSNLKGTGKNYKAIDYVPNAQATSQDTNQMLAQLAQIAAYVQSQIDSGVQGVTRWVGTNPSMFSPDASQATYSPTATSGSGGNAATTAQAQAVSIPTDQQNAALAAQSQMPSFAQYSQQAQKGNTPDWLPDGASPVRNHHFTLDGLRYQTPRREGPLQSTALIPTDGSGGYGQSYGSQAWRNGPTR